MADQDEGKGSDVPAQADTTAPVSFSITPFVASGPSAAAAARHAASASASSSSAAAAASSSTGHQPTLGSKSKSSTPSVEWDDMEPYEQLGSLPSRESA